MSSVTRLVHAAESVDGDLFDEELLDLFGLHNLFFNECFAWHRSSSDISILVPGAFVAGPNRARLHS
jgi:hypothetical protein